MSEWSYRRLGDLVRIKHGYAFEGRYFTDAPPGSVLVTPGNFEIGGGWKETDRRYYAGPVPPGFTLRKGDLIVTMTDLSKNADTLGYPAMVPGGGLFLHNQRIGLIEPQPGAEVDPRFLYYALRSREYRWHVLASATGTTVRHTSPSRILDFKFPVPDLRRQKAIADVLGALDDKIDLNRTTSATLEELMHATYASRWRTNDRSIALADVVECHRDPVDPRQVGPDTVYVGLEHMTPRSLNLEKHGRAMDVGSGKAAFQLGDVLFGRLRPYFHKVAVAHTVGIASQEILVLRPRSPELLGLAICEASHPGLIDHATAVSTGTRMPRASWADIASFRFGYRGSPAEITEFVSPLLNLMQSYIGQNETLAQLRDLLLPKLMSGEIRIKGAEKAVAEAL